MRTEELSDPFGALGLFWNMVPFWCDFPNRKNRKREELQKVQKLSNEIDSYYGRYPLLQILRDQSQEELFFASFNFIHFRDSQESFQIVNQKAYDAFHPPLGLLVHRGVQKTIFSFSYDEAYFEESEIAKLSEKYKQCFPFLD